MCLNEGTDEVGGHGSRGPGLQCLDVPHERGRIVRTRVHCVFVAHEGVGRHVDNKSLANSI